MKQVDIASTIDHLGKYKLVNTICVWNVWNTLDMFICRRNLNSAKSFGSEVSFTLIGNVWPTPFEKMNNNLPIALTLGLYVGSCSNWPQQKTYFKVLECHLRILIKDSELLTKYWKYDAVHSCILCLRRIWDTRGYFITNDKSIGRQLPGICCSSK